MFTGSIRLPEEPIPQLSELVFDYTKLRRVRSLGFSKAASDKESSSEVFLMVDDTDGKGETFYAVRVFQNELKPEQTEFFLNEIDVMRAFTHPCVIQLAGYYFPNTAQNKAAAILYEHAVNYSMPKALEFVRRGLPPPLWKESRIMNIAIGIAMGMKYIHRKGFIHRCLRPSKILFGEKFVPKISGFQLTRLAKRADNEKDDLLPYVSYTAPEQLEGDEFGAAVDVWSYGMLIYELVTNKPPYDPELPPQERKKLILSGKTPELSRRLKIPEWARLLLPKCWKMTPTQRPSFSEIILLLKNSPEFNAANVKFYKYIHAAEIWDSFNEKQLAERCSDLEQEILFLKRAYGSVVRSMSMKRAEIQDYDNIFEAAEDGSIEAVAQFIKRKGINLSMVDEKSRTSLFHSIKGKHFDCACYLIESGIPINGVDNEGNSPLMYATKYDEPEIAKILMDRGADVNCTNKEGKTALLYALTNQQLDVVHGLIARDCNLNVMTENFWTPLHLAIRFDMPEIANELLDKGANFDSPNSQGYTPLMLAIQRYQKELALRLIEQDADISAQSADGMTPYLLAHKLNFDDVCDQMAVRGADTCVEDTESIQTAGTTSVSQFVF